MYLVTKSDHGLDNNANISFKSSNEEELLPDQPPFDRINIEFARGIEPIAEESEESKEIDSNYFQATTHSNSGDQSRPIIVPKLNFESLSVIEKYEPLLNLY